MSDTQVPIETAESTHVRMPTRRFFVLATKCIPSGVSYCVRRLPVHTGAQRNVDYSGRIPDGGAQLWRFAPAGIRRVDDPAWLWQRIIPFGTLPGA